MSSETAKRLAVAQHERRHAIYDVSGTPSEIPPPPRVPAFPEARDRLPTLDDLTGPEAPKARWKLVLALAAALGGLGELARQVATLLGKH